MRRISKTRPLFMTVAALACFACADEPEPTEALGSLDLPLATQIGDTEYRVIGTIRVRQVSSGAIVAEVAASADGPSSHTVALPPGGYTLEVEDGYSCSVEPADATFAGCTFTGAEPEPFVVTADQTVTVVMSFVFRFDEDVDVAMRTGDATLVLEPVEQRPCGADGCALGEVCVSLDAAEPSCGKECGGAQDCPKGQACFALSDDDGGGVCADLVTTLWTRQFGESRSDTVSELAVDREGNVLAVGFVTPDDMNDDFVTKYDRDGNVLWTRDAGYDRYDTAYAVATDSQGNVFVAGSTFELSYLQKFAADGELVWTRELVAGFGAGGLAVTGDGEVILAGAANDALAGFEHAGRWDVAAQKLDADGEVLWTWQFGTAENDYANAASVDTEGNVYLAGSTDGFLPGGDSRGMRDAFVVKLNARGDWQWTQQLGANRDDDAAGIAVDPSGNVLVGGSMWQYTNASDLDRDTFVAKLDSAGETIWFRQSDGAELETAAALAVDSSGNVVLGGYEVVVNGGPARAFASKYDAGGELVWTHRTEIEDTYGYALAVDQEGAVLLGGSLYGEFSGHTSAGGSDAFVRKLSP